MYGQPNGLLITISPFNAMFFVSRDVNVVTGFENKEVQISFKLNACATLKQDDPFVPGLVIPLSCWSCVPFGYDPFDPEATVFDNSIKNFDTAHVRQIFEEVFYFHDAVYLSHTSI